MPDRPGDAVKAEKGRNSLDVAAVLCKGKLQQVLIKSRLAKARIAERKEREKRNFERRYSTDAHLVVQLGGTMDNLPKVSAGDHTSYTMTPTGSEGLVKGSSEGDGRNVCGALKMSA
eukprot:gene3355-4215_t